MARSDWRASLRGVATAVCLVSSAPGSEALAFEVPLAVSPGSPTGSLVDDICPTFNWSAVPDATSYELAVYRISDGVDAGPILRRSFPGAVFGWTPSLDACLARGGRYAWSVRAIGEDGESAWSSPGIFEVTSVPSTAEFEQALGVVRRYLEARSNGDTSDLRGPLNSSEGRRGSVARTPDMRDPSEVQLDVRGTVQATSYTGDGSNLEGVVTDLELAAHDAEESAHSDKQQRVTGLCPDGSSIRVVNSDGSVLCESDDDTTYVAGGGLAASGTTFSVADAGISTAMLDDGAVTDAKVVSVSASKVTAGSFDGDTYNANGIWRVTSCPSGYSAVGGTNGNLCWSGWRSPQNRQDADRDCFDEGAHMCTYSEFYHAWNSGSNPAPFVNDAIGERVGDDLVLCFNNTSNIGNFEGTCDKNSSLWYRCCVGRGR